MVDEVVGLDDYASIAAQPGPRRKRSHCHILADGWACGDDQEGSKYGYGGHPALWEGVASYLDQNFQPMNLNLLSALPREVSGAES